MYSWETQTLSFLLNSWIAWSKKTSVVYPPIALGWGRSCIMSLKVLAPCCSVSFVTAVDKADMPFRNSMDFVDKVPLWMMLHWKLCLGWSFWWMARRFSADFRELSTIMLRYLCCPLPRPFAMDFVSNLLVPPYFYIVEKTWIVPYIFMHWPWGLPYAQNTSCLVWHSHGSL